MRKGLLRMKPVSDDEVLDRFHCTKATRRQSIVKYEIATLAHLRPHRILAIVHRRKVPQSTCARPNGGNVAGDDRKGRLEQALLEYQVVEPLHLRRRAHIGATEVAPLVPVAGG